MFSSFTILFYRDEGTEVITKRCDVMDERFSGFKGFIFSFVESVMSIGWPRGLGDVDDGAYMP